MRMLSKAVLAFIALGWGSAAIVLGAAPASPQPPSSAKEHPMSAPATQPQTAQPGTTQPARANRLVNETSPYLLQHAHNPVDWYAWGPAAFEAARAQDKPIFLSIGYSTCYWCHVMERESFENADVAAVMNENFICIKVDREERPDVDEIYMAATQMLSGSGGWPMSVFLEPRTLKPFVAGTYFPPTDSFGRPGFPSVLRQIAGVWKNDRDVALRQADQVADAVREHLSKSAQPVAIGQREVENAITDLLAGYDPKHGGFVHPSQRAPKFPTPVNLEFLIGAGWELKPVRDAVLHTLDRMAMGGMYDQVGGGFHRYSVDEKWLVPHFEKMLYDNGQLASVYARVYELTKDPYYAEVLRETLDYVLREMTSADGAFFSAQDAEVNAREGDNYLWTESEVRDALTGAGLKDDVDFALNVYGLRGGPNFQDPHHPEQPPRNVLYLSDKPANVATKLNLSTEEFNTRLSRVNRALLDVRNKREQPGLDDKVLAGWNGLMIAGMAEGGRVLNEKKYKDAAARAAGFVLQKMRASDGGLLRSHRAGQTRIDAFLEDYALMIRGLIALHRSANDRRALEDAKRLAQIARGKFWDSAAGGYFDTLENQSDLFVRVKSTYDGAVPSGNSMMLLNLLDLHELTGHIAHLDDAAATLKSMSSAIKQHPTGSILATLALQRMAKNYPQRIDLAPAIASPAMPTQSGPVRVSVQPNEITVKPGAPASFTVTLHIVKPYHVNANKPGDEFLIPLSVSLTGCDGLRIVPEYPAGESYKSEFSTGTIYAHAGSVTFPVRVEQTGKLVGTPRLSITYQTCTDKECLEPKTETLGVRIVAER